MLVKHFQIVKVETPSKIQLNWPFIQLHCFITPKYREEGDCSKSNLELKQDLVESVQLGKTFKYDFGLVCKATSILSHGLNGLNGLNDLHGSLGLNCLIGFNCFNGLSWLIGLNG